jgi:hypothetical protein
MAMAFSSAKVAGSLATAWVSICLFVMGAASCWEWNRLSFVVCGKGKKKWVVMSFFVLTAWWVL